MLTGEQIRAARALLRIGQDELADLTKTQDGAGRGVSLETIKRLEGMAGVVKAQLATVIATKHALEAAGVIFIDSNGEGPGVRLRKNASE